MVPEIGRRDGLGDGVGTSAGGSGGSDSRLEYCALGLGGEAAGLGGGGRLEDGADSTMVGRSGSHAKCEGGWLRGRRQELLETRKGCLRPLLAPLTAPRWANNGARILLGAHWDGYRDLERETDET
jgi:hypothetical protein